MPEVPGSAETRKQVEKERRLSSAFAFGGLYMHYLAARQAILDGRIKASMARAEADSVIARMDQELSDNIAAANVASQGTGFRSASNVAQVSASSAANTRRDQNVVDLQATMVRNALMASAHGSAAGSALQGAASALRTAPMETAAEETAGRIKDANSAQSHSKWNHARNFMPSPPASAGSNNGWMKGPNLGRVGPAKGPAQSVVKSHTGKV